MLPKSRCRSVLNASCVMLALSALSLQAQAQWRSVGDDFHDKMMHLGTGPEGGTFSSIGNTLCDTLNEASPSSPVRCVPLRSAGSIFNIYAVANGSLQLGLGQEETSKDSVYYARRSTLVRHKVL